MCPLGRRAFRGTVARHNVVHVGVSLFSFREGAYRVFERLSSQGACGDDRGSVDREDTAKRRCAWSFLVDPDGHLHVRITIDNPGTVHPLTRKTIQL